MSTPLLDSLAQSFAGDAARRATLQTALADGLPHARSERWKYTSLRGLARRSFMAATSTSIDPARLAHIPSPRVVFVNGQYDAALSSHAGFPSAIDLHTTRDALQNPDPRARGFLDREYRDSDAVFARLNAALTTDGMVLRIAEDTALAQPVHLVEVIAPTGQDMAWHPRHCIELQRGASLTLVEHVVSMADAAHLSNAVVQVHLAQDAQLQHARVQSAGASTTLFARTDAVLARDAGYARLDLELGAVLSRHELNIRLAGDHARVQANGVLLGDGKRHLDTRLDIQHIARNTQCDLQWRGLADGRARCAFHGGITIRAGADGSDARLSNRNLLLGENAEIDAQPVLEIHADEVKAAHGATVGQLDPTALFYLRSRGLPETQARQLLTSAFCQETLALMPDGVQASLRDVLDGALARLERA